MNISKTLGAAVGILVLMIGLLFIGARFHDGPIAIIPGGPLASGDFVREPVTDWSFATSIDLIEFQLVADDTSRTTWIVVNDGHAYIPCSLGFPPGKDWHLRADADGNAVIRLLEKRYAVTLDRISGAPLQAKLEAIVAEKYSGGPPGEADVWFFALSATPS